MQHKNVISPIHTYSRHTTLCSLQPRHQHAIPPNPLRVVLCGRTPSIGKTVATHLLPEYEVIHFIQTIETAKADIPRLLSGQSPQIPTPNITTTATLDYSQPPRAVIFGRGYEPYEVEDVRRACAGRSAQPVAWVLGDPAQAPPGWPGPGYAVQVAEKVKGVLDGWRAGGGRTEEVFMY